MNRVTSLTHCQVLVLGLGETGLSMVRWLQAQGAEVCVADSRVQPPGLAQVTELLPASRIYCGDWPQDLLRDVTLLALSPGVSLATPLVQQAMAQGIEVVGDVELFARHLASLATRPKVAAITGSNGKTTVTSMVVHICREAGLDAVAAGNISPAVLQVLLQREHMPQVWVLELSSFQLETTQSLAADVATVLNVCEDHLDRYQGSMAGYAAAKARIFAGDGLQLLNRDDMASMQMQLSERQLLSFGLTAPISPQDYGVTQIDGCLWLVQGERRLLACEQLALAGRHNQANALAAAAICHRLGLSDAQIAAGLISFRGLPHRVEYVTTLARVDYFNDSKGTNVGATLAALQGLQRQLVLIAGGVGKGQDFSPLADVAARFARAVVLIGQDADQIAQALSPTTSMHYAVSMAQAVEMAARLAQPGDAVLLSPACASFDMFTSYIHRGEAFCAAVAQLQEVENGIIG